MRRLILAGALAFLMAVSVAAVASAEVIVLDSLEWMAADTPLIVQGNVIGYEDTVGLHGVTYRSVTVQVHEVLKGQHTDDTVKFRLYGFKERPVGTEWKESGHSFLFFLRKGRPEDGGPLVGWWVPRSRLQGIIDLEQPMGTYKADMKRPSNAKEILDIVRHWAAWKKPVAACVGEANIFKPQAGYRRIEIPFDAEIHREVHAGSTCYINVPAEENYRPLAMEKAKSQQADERMEGAQMLCNYPGPETVKLLTELLEDPFESKWSSGSGELVKITYVYIVRRAAYESLLALGEKPEKPIFERLPTPEEIQDVRDRHRAEVFSVEEGSHVSRYPGGSPFPPGQEPSLTHIVKVYWTTLGGVVTHIRVKADGERPTRLQCVRIENGKEATVHSAIAPDCDHSIRLASTKQSKAEGVADWIVEGQGTVTVRVHGFRAEDFADPPQVSVRYLKNDVVVGETSIQAQPVPEVLRQEEAAAKSIRQLICDLTSGDQHLADSAKWELGRRGRPAVPALLALVQDRTAKGRDIAAISLGITKDPDAVPVLIECLRDEDWHVRGRAAYALSQIGGEEAKDGLVDFLSRCLEEDDYRVNLTKAAESIKELPDARAFPQLMTIVDDAVRGKRRGHAVVYAAEALGKMGDPRASGALAKLLDPSIPYDRSRDYIYLEAIHRTRGRDALPLLVAYLETVAERMEGQPELTGIIGKEARQANYNARLYAQTVACLEAISGRKSEGGTRREVLRYWRDYAGRTEVERPEQEAR